MDDVREGFVQAALHAKKAGFDGVEVHGANGYLMWPRSPWIFLLPGSVSK